MRLYGVTEKEIDVLSFALMAVEQEKEARKEMPKAIKKRAKVRTKRGDK